MKNNIIKLIVLVLLFQAAAISCSGHVKKYGKDTKKAEEKSQYTKKLGDEIGPKKIKDMKPRYPILARKERIQGAVWVKGYVDTTGNVTDVVIAKDSGTNVGFEEAALEAARQTKWIPAKIKGKPVAVWTSWKITFSIE